MEPASPFEPLNDRVVIRPDVPGERVTKGGLYLPENHADRYATGTGTVVAVGPGKLLDDGRRAAPYLAAGDRVCYPKFSGDDVEYDGDTFRAMPEGNVVCRLPPAKAEAPAAEGEPRRGRRML